MTAKKSDKKTTPAPETRKILKGVSESLDIDMSIIKEKFNELLGSRAIQNLKVPTEPERERHAVRVLVAQLTAEKDRKEFSGKVEPVTIRIESKEPINEFKKAGTEESGYRAGLYTTVEDGEENVGIARLALWNDGCECHPNLNVGETYTTECVVGSRGNIWEMSMNEPTEVECSDKELPLMKELITKSFTPIPIEDVENNISKDRDDPKLVEGVVVSGWQKITASNRDMGFLKIMPDLMNFDDAIVAKFGGDANIVNTVGEGDLVYVLGQTTPAVLNDDGSEKYSIGMWGELIIPVLAMEHIEDTADEDEEVEDGEDEGEDEDEGEGEDLEEKIGDW